MGDIGIADENSKWKSITRHVVDQNMVDDVIIDRPQQAHKGTFGKTLIIAGSNEFPGAALLAAKAASRSGVGLVSIAHQEKLQKMIASEIPEATWLHNLQESRIIQEYDSILIGPGINEKAWAALNLADFLESPKLPNLILDAQTLRYLGALSEGPGVIKNLSILTPHPGEMAALTGLSTAEIQNDRLLITEKYAAKWGHIVLLKGALTVVAHPQGETAIIPIANPALATAGSGDVLAGIIAAWWAQGMKAFDAAYVGAWAHAQAANFASNHFSSDRGIVASDLLTYLPKILTK